MMLTIRAAAWNQLSDTKKAILTAVGDRLDLGTPARFKQDRVEWLVWDDHRLTLRDLARVERMLTESRQGYRVPTTETGRHDRRQLREDTKVDVAIPEDATPQLVLDRQDARGLDGIPEDWTRVDPET